MYIGRCYICNCEFDYDATDDICPCCDWFNILDYSRSPIDIDDPDTNNPLTIRQARTNFAKGLNVWGKPINKKYLTHN